MNAESWFGTPVFRSRCDNSVQLEQLKEYLVCLKNADTSNINYTRGFSNTGWHSRVWNDDNQPGQLSNIPEFFRNNLRSSMETLLAQEVSSKQYRIFQLDTELVFWSIINEIGNYNLRHIHTSNARDTWSCVLYVHSPVEAGCGGEIRFFNPNMAYRCSQGTTLSKLGGQGMYRTITPATGDLICFPGWLEHDVLPFSGDGERVIVAANLGLTRLVVESAITGEQRQVI